MVLSRDGLVAKVSLVVFQKFGYGHMTLTHSRELARFRLSSSDKELIDREATALAFDLL